MTQTGLVTAVREKTAPDPVYNFVVGPRAAERLAALARPLPLLVLTVVLRCPALVLPQFFSGDEAIYSALALRMLHGYDMYAGAVDHKPVGVNLLYAAVYAVVGSNHIVAVRIVLILVVWATGLAVARLAVLLDGRRAAAFAGVLYVCASAAGQPRDAQAANTELFLNLPIAAAAILVARTTSGRPALSAGNQVQEPPPHDLLQLFLAGILTGVGGLFKYQSALAGAAWALVVVWAAPRSTRTLARLTALAAGFVLVAVVLCGVFYLRGDWDAFTFWGWTYNFTYINVLTIHEKLRSFAMGTFWALVYWAALVALAVAAALARRLHPLTIAWFVAACVAISIGGRFFRFYYLMALPPLALTAASGVETLADMPAWWRWSVLAAGVLSLSAALVLPWTWKWIQPGFQREHETLAAVGAYIKAHSSPEDRVFIWGNSSQIYYFADRVMATRFAFCNYQTGKIWGSWSWDADAGDTSQFVVPRAWTELLEDLDREPPQIIVDGGAGHLAAFDRYPIWRYPQLASRVSRSYRLEAVVSGVPIYHRFTP